MTVSFAITRLDIMQSYFVGRVKFRGDEYTVNIQPQKRGKVLKLPFKLGNRSGSGSSGVNLATPEVTRAAPPTSRLFGRITTHKDRWICLSGIDRRS